MTSLPKGLILPVARAIFLRSQRLRILALAERDKGPTAGEQRFDSNAGMLNR
jgi:hypothetical protein